AQTMQQAAPLLYKNVGDMLEGQDESVKVAVHALVGGLVSKALGGDFGTGAAAVGGATAAIALLSDQLDSIPTTLSKDERDAILQLAGQTVAYAISGGGSQGNAASAAAGMADLYNRQIHPEEKDLARELAQKSGGKYSAKEIESALALADNVTLGEKAFEDGKQPPLGATLGLTPDLMAYVMANTGQTYEWDTVLAPSAQPTTFCQSSDCMPAPVSFGPQTISGGLSLSGIVGVGLVSGLGYYASSPDGGNNGDVGVYVTYGKGAGWDLSFSVTSGINKGGVDDFRGTSESLNLGFGIFGLGGGASLVKNSAGEATGGSISIGSKGPGTVSVTTTRTCTFSIVTRDFKC
ncbi:hypothetical protein ACDA63_08465, partial [Uliginosibacterium sp. sgz301328]|uniref:hypothetical protein n=1 Tax=Uliginosibacterium sp. sgz301328 TaxID=3243764 RepID=UPI00359D6A88